MTTELPIDLTTKSSEAISTSKLEEHVSETTIKPKLERDHISEITTKPKLEDHITETTAKPKFEDHIIETTAQPKFEDHISELTTETLIEKDEVVELTTKVQLISESSIEDKVSTPKSIESSSHLPDKDKVEVTSYDYLTTKLPVEIETEFSKSSEDRKDLTTQFYEQSSTRKPQHISSEAIQKEFEVTTIQSLKTDMKDKVEESEIVTEMPTVILDKLTTIEHVEPIRTTQKTIEVGVETKKLTTEKPEEFTTSREEEISKTETLSSETLEKEKDVEVTERATTTQFVDIKISSSPKFDSSVSSQEDITAKEPVESNEIDEKGERLKEKSSTPKFIKKDEISELTTKPTISTSTFKGIFDEKDVTTISEDKKLEPEVQTISTLIGIEKSTISTKQTEEPILNEIVPSENQTVLVPSEVASTETKLTTSSTEELVSEESYTKAPSFIDKGTSKSDGSTTISSLREKISSVHTLAYEETSVNKLELTTEGPEINEVEVSSKVPQETTIIFDDKQKVELTTHISKLPSQQTSESSIIGKQETKI